MGTLSAEGTIIRYPRVSLNDNNKTFTTSTHTRVNPLRTSKVKDLHVQLNRRAWTLLLRCINIDVFLRKLYNYL